jgi:hypothetical protein
MGYFSNASEGLAYQKQWCFRCKHWPDDSNEGGCTVWSIHQLHNYKQCEKSKIGSLLKEILGCFITQEKTFNCKCAMFVQREGELPGQKHLEF